MAGGARDPAELRAELARWLGEYEQHDARMALVDQCLPRYAATLDILPDDLRGKDVLELGASPFLFTLILRGRGVRRHALGSWYGDGAKHGTHRLTNRDTGEELVLSYDSFDAERDIFPYPDQSFDLVSFAEMIEHLGVNPIHTLAEIHRVLRPDGHVIITTPNAMSMDRFENFLAGGRPTVDRYTPTLGYGGRHNREYSPWEVVQLLEGTGFVVEQTMLRDLLPPTGYRRVRRALFRRLLRWYFPVPRDEHIFVRARRGPTFRWHFSPALFDAATLPLLGRAAVMEVGANDSVQCRFGWTTPVPGAPERYVDGVAQVALQAPRDATQVAIECRLAGDDARPLRVVVRDRYLWHADPANVYFDASVVVAPGAWTTTTCVLERTPDEGSEVEVLLGLDVPATETPVPGRRDGNAPMLAVRRVGFVAAARAAHD